MKQTLTDQQRKTFEFICHYSEQYGYAPKLTEIATGIGIRSRGVVHRYIQALSEAGLVRVIPNSARGIEIIQAPQKQSFNYTLPLLGKIAAGKPIEVLPGQETINLAEWFKNEDEMFALNVAGQSMIDAGILDGDTVVCQLATRAEPHQIAVVLVDNTEATLKYCINHGDGTVTLKPANANMQPQTIDIKRIQIQGIVVSQLRRYE